MGWLILMVTTGSSNSTILLPTKHICRQQPLTRKEHLASWRECLIHTTQARRLVWRQVDDLQTKESMHVRLPYPAQAGKSSCKNAVKKRCKSTAQSTVNKQPRSKCMQAGCDGAGLAISTPYFLSAVTPPKAGPLSYYHYSLQAVAVKHRLSHASNHMNKSCNNSMNHSHRTLLRTHAVADGHINGARCHACFC